MSNIKVGVFLTDAAGLKLLGNFQDQADIQIIGSSLCAGEVVVDARKEPCLFLQYIPVPPLASLSNTSERGGPDYTNSHIPNIKAAGKPEPDADD